MEKLRVKYLPNFLVILTILLSAFTGIVTIVSNSASVGATSVPTVTTQACTDTNSVYTFGHFSITNTGGENADKIGICYSSVNNLPTVADSTSESSGSFGVSSYSKTVYQLIPKTTYYMRGYAHNSAGYGYGTVETITTPGGVWTGTSSPKQSTVYMVDTDSTYVYAVLKNTTSSVSQVVQINKSDMTLVATWTCPVTNYYSLFVHCFDGYVYVSILTSPGKVYKIDPATMTTVGDPWTGATGENAPCGLTNDGTNLYVGLWNSPLDSIVRKIDVATMTTTGSSWTESGVTRLWSLEYNAGYLYAAFEMTPGLVYKIDPATMATEGTPWTSGDTYCHNLSFDATYFYINSENNERIYQVTLANMTTNDASPSNIYLAGGYGGTSLGAYVYYNYVNNPYVDMIQTSDMSVYIQGDYTTYGSAMHGATNDGTYIYMGMTSKTTGLSRVLRIDPATMLVAGVDTAYVSSIVPTKGTTADNSLLTNITGTGFISGVGLEAQLNFNGSDYINGTSVTWLSNTSMSAIFDLSGVTTNLGSAWDIKITNPDTTTVLGADIFTIYYPNPTVSAITPNTGPNDAPVNITNLAGTNFINGSTSAKLTKSGQSDIAMTSIIVVSAIKITGTFDLTGVDPGLWNVVVTVTGAESTSTLSNSLWTTVGSISTPTVTSINPTKGTTEDTTLYTTITGTGFISGLGLAAEINFNGATPITGTSVTWLSNTSVSAVFDLSGVTTNLGSAWDVVVTNPDTGNGMANNIFTIYRPDPTISAITPNLGTNTGPVNITNLAGTGFVNGLTTAKLTKVAESDIIVTGLTWVSATKLTGVVNITGVVTGLWSVVVTITGAESTGIGSDLFTVTNLISPTVSTSVATAVSYLTATLNGNLTNMGTASPVICSFEWGNVGGYGNTTTTVSKNAIGTYSVNLAGLTYGTMYYYRAKAVGDGTSYGSQVNFTTLSTVAPTVTTVAATSVSYLTATINGNLNDKGTASSIVCYIEWGNVGGYGNITTTTIKASTGTFSFDLTGLEYNTTYYYRAVASGHGTSYGSQVNFTTLAYTDQSITTDTVGNLDHTTATLKGTITSMGSQPSIVIYFEWGTTTSYGHSTAHVTKTSASSVSAGVMSLTPGSSYHYRLVSIGSTVVYGSDVNFTATPESASAATARTIFYVVPVAFAVVCVVLMFQAFKGGGSSDIAYAAAISGIIAVISFIVIYNLVHSI